MYCKIKVRNRSIKVNCKVFSNRKKFVKVVKYKDTCIFRRCDDREKRKSNGSDAGR